MIKPSEPIIKIEIPVKAHIKRYIVKSGYLVYGTQLTEADPVGIMLSKLIEPKPKTRTPPFSPIAYKTYHCLDLSLGRNIHNYHRPYISHESVKLFNEFCDKILMYEMVKCINIMNEFAGTAIKESILAFFDKYDIEDHELTFEAAKKYYFRYRKRAETIV